MLSFLIVGGLIFGYLIQVAVMRTNPTKYVIGKNITPPSQDDEMIMQAISILAGFGLAKREAKHLISNVSDYHSIDELVDRCIDQIH